MICHGSYFEFASLNVYSSDYNNHNIIYYNIGDQVRKKNKNGVIYNIIRNCSSLKRTPKSIVPRLQ